MSSELIRLANSIATTIRDYEKVNEMNADHVLKWADNFQEHDRVRLLRNTDSLLSKTYISKSDYIEYLRSVAQKHASEIFLNIQIRGSSQNKMLTLLSTLYKETHKRPMIVYTDDMIRNTRPIVGTSPTSSHDKNYQHFVYLDDVSFTGNRIMADLPYWIANHAPQHCTLHIKLIAAHTQGVEDIKNEVERVSRIRGKNIYTLIECYDIYENRLEHINGSDVFCPKNGTILIPQDIVDKKVYGLRESTYIEQCPPVYRRNGFSNDGGIFGDDEAERDWYEKIICEKGLELLSEGITEKSWLKPLGFKKEDGLGFGGAVFTYLNCPNNTPIVFWWGAAEEFYPLMPRTPS